MPAMVKGRGTLQRAELEAMLACASWAKHLASSELQRVIAQSSQRRVPAGKYVCRKGERVDAWTGVIVGLVKLGSVSPEGKLVTYTGVTAGGWFGEGSLLKNEPRRYDAIALRDTRVARIPRETFHWLLDSSIPFNRFIMGQLNERLGQMIAMLEYDRLASPDARLAHCLASLFNPQLYPGTSVNLQLSQEEIGHLSGLSRQRVNRGLHALEKRGLLRVQFGGITVRDLAGLRDFIG